MKKIVFTFSLIILSIGTAFSQYVTNTGPSSYVPLYPVPSEVHRSFYYEFMNSGHNLFLDLVNNGWPDKDIVFTWNYRGNIDSLHFNTGQGIMDVVGDPAGESSSVAVFYRNWDTSSVVPVRGLYCNVYEFDSTNNSMSPILEHYLVDSLRRYALEVDVDHQGNIIILNGPEHVISTNFPDVENGTFGSVVKVFGTTCADSGDVVDVAISSDEEETIVSMSANIYGGEAVSVIQTNYNSIVNDTFDTCTIYEMKDTAGNIVYYPNYSAGFIAGRSAIEQSAKEFAVMYGTNNKMYVSIFDYPSSTLVAREVTNTYNQNGCNISGGEVEYSNDFVNVLFVGEDCHGYFNSEWNGLRKRYFHDGQEYDTTYSLLNSQNEGRVTFTRSHARFSANSGQLIGTSYSSEDTASFTQARYRFSNQNSIQKRAEASPVSTSLSKRLYKVSIFPNPTTENLYVNSGNEHFKKYSINDLLGRTVESGKVIQAYDHFVIHLEDLKSGIYILELSDENNRHIFREKFVKR